MIRDSERWHAFERQLVANQQLDFTENLRLVDDMYAYAQDLAGSRPRMLWKGSRRISDWPRCCTVFEELLKQLALGLDRAGLPYMVFGGQAVLLYGEPRLTRDIDITLGVDTGQVAALLRVIEQRHWRILVDDVDEFLRQTFVLPVLDPESNIRIDFVFSLTGYERLAIERGKMVRLGEVDVRFVSLEDLIVMKVISGRPRDIEDVASVIRKNPGFDQTHVRRWLNDFDSELDGHFVETFEQIMATVRF